MNTNQAKLTIAIQNAAIKGQRWQSCLNCIHWSKSGKETILDPTQNCGYREVETGPSCMEFKVLPPPEVLVVGCENHEWDIPF